MKLSITPISFTQGFRSGKVTTRWFIDYVAGQQLDGIDLLDPDHYTWAWTGETNLGDCLARMRDHGLEVAAFACGNNFAKADPGERLKQVAMVHRGIERAAECGAKCLRVFGGYLAETGGDPGIDEETGLRLVIEGLEKCINQAESQGIVLALENHGRLPGTSAQMLRILQALDSPWLKLTFDPANCQGNSMPHDEDPLAAYENVAGQIAHVHFKDVREPLIDLGRRREACVAGTGMTPLKDVAARLHRDGYKGYCTLEFEAGRFVDETQGVTESLDFLKQIVRC